MRSNTRVLRISDKKKRYPVLILSTCWHNMIKLSLIWAVILGLNIKKKASGRSVLLERNFPMPIKRLIFLTRSAVQSALLTLIIMLAIPVGSALSEDNSLRIGGDYKFITLREGAEPRECRRACEKDVSCKAWTFIKERVKKERRHQFQSGA